MFVKRCISNRVTVKRRQNPADLIAYLSRIRKAAGVLRVQIDPFVDQFVKIFIMIVGATLLAGLLWRFNYERKRRIQEAAWAAEAGSEDED